MSPTRRQFMAGAATAPLAFSLPSIGGSDVLTPAAAEFVADHRLFQRGSFGPDPKRYDGKPSWIVSLADEEDFDALEDWADESDDRRVIREDEEATVATVSAPLSDIAAIRGSTLADKSYVERIDIDFVASYAEPVRLPLDEDADWHTHGTIDSLAVGEPAPGTDGVAFEADRSTLGDVREALDVDDVSETGDGVTVAVIDTGCNAGSMFEDNEGSSRILDASKDFTVADEPTVEEDGLDAVSDHNSGKHGTWVSAAIAADPADEEYRGMAPDADLLVLRALDDDGSGSTADIAAAVRYATDQGADLLCMSLGSPVYSAELADALKDARDEGTLPFVAAGNDRQLTRFVNYPASDGAGVAISATTTADDPDEVKSAAFANVGPQNGVGDLSEGETAGGEVRLGAPGMELEAELPGGLRTLSGTSMATPIACGIAALVLESESLDLDELTERLVETAEPGEKLAEAEVGAGIVNAANAIADDEPEDDQADVMDDDAAARDAWYRAESDARGGLLSRYVL